MAGHREIEIVAKEIQDNNPGMAYQSAIEFAKKKCNKQKKEPDYIIYYANKLFI